MSETRLIRISVDLLESFGTRTSDGRLITAEWGEPVASCGAEPGLVMDVYEPTFTATDDGMTVVRRDYPMDQEQLALALLAWSGTSPLEPTFSVTASPRNMSRDIARAYADLERKRA